MTHQFPRPKILISRCLGFAACRYDGQQLHSGFVEILQDHVDFVDVCPEVEAGLGKYHAIPSVSAAKTTELRSGNRQSRGL